MKSLRQIAQEQVVLSPLMEGREKIKMETLVRKYPEGVTITSVDKIPDSKTGELYSIFTFDEDDSLFASGGVVMNKIVDAWLKEYDNDLLLLNHDLAESGEVKIKFSYERTSNNRDIVKCVVL